MSETGLSDISERPVWVSAWSQTFNGSIVKSIHPESNGKMYDLCKQ